MSNSGKLELQGTSGSCSFLNSGSPGSTPTQSQIKINDLQNSYHNPDALFRLVGEVNETTVFVEGQEARALRLWFSIISHFIGMGKEIKSETTTTSINIAN